MFTSNCRCCPFGQKFTGGVLNLSKSCTFCPLGQTWLEISIKTVMCNAHEGKMVISLSTLSFPPFITLTLFLHHTITLATRRRDGTSVCRPF
ncbi:hypothetical protein Hanom_Chr05g00464541 [Helianthus anomalus]